MTSSHRRVRKRQARDRPSRRQAPADRRGGLPGLATQTTTIDGRTIMYAIDLVAGTSTLLAVAEVEDAYARAFAPSLEGTLSAGTVAEILPLFAAITP